MNLASYQPGQIIYHAGRTLGDMDNSWYTLLTLNTAEHFNLDSGRQTPFGRTLFNSTFTLAAMMGAVRSELAPGLPVEMLIDDVALTKPLFGGDTLYPQTTVCSAERDDVGGTYTLLLHSIGLSQLGHNAIEIDWRLVYKTGVDMQAIIESRRLAAPLLDPARAFQPQVIAPAYEDFTIGNRHDHVTGRTMLADESIWMALLAMNKAPWNIDRHWATANGFADILIDDFFVLSCVLGFSVKHATQKSVANLGWKNIRFGYPVLPGDTLSSESEILDKRLSQSRPGQGIVHIRTIGRNQRAEVVASYDRRFLIPCRGCPAASTMS